MSSTAQPDDQRYDEPLRYEDLSEGTSRACYYQATAVARRLSADMANSIVSKRWPWTGIVITKVITSGAIRDNPRFSDRPRVPSSRTSADTLG
jgi:hypothetical protein